MLGGMTMAMELDVAIRAVENGAENLPSSTIAGIRTAPRAATVAGPEPEIAPKKQATITHTMAIPPLLCPTQVFTNLISLLEIPAFAIIFPDNTKNGIANSKNLLIPEYTLVATMVRDVPEYRIAQTEDSPRQMAMGTFKIKNTKKDKNNTALTIYTSPFFFTYWKSVHTSRQYSIKCRTIHPAPIGIKDQKIHSGQFRTKVRFPFSNWVSTLSKPYRNSTAVNATDSTVIITATGFLLFFGNRSVSRGRLTSSPSRQAKAAATRVINTNTATTNSSVKDQER